MKKKLIFLFFVCFCFLSVSAQEKVSVNFVEYNSGNSRFNGCRVIMKNLGEKTRDGKIIISSYGTATEYEIILQPGEIKIVDTAVSSSGSSSYLVRFGEDKTNHYLNNSWGSSLNSEFGVIEVKDPKKGQPLYNVNNSNIDSYCKVARIDVHDIPLNYYCFLGFQLVILPMAEEPKLSAEQFQVLKNYVNFGGKVLLLGSGNSLPKRWASLNESAYGRVIILPYQDEIDLSAQVSKQDIISPQSYFLNSLFAFDLKFSDKTIYLILVILFVVLVGPINFYVLQRKNKKILLFLTTPILAIVFSLLLIIVFFIKEGFYKYYQGVSVSLVNQSSGQILLNARNNIYLSNLTSDLVRSKNEFFFPANSDFKDTYLNIFKSQQILSGNYSKSRSVNDFNQIGLYDCNSKIVITNEAGEPKVRNGFGSSQKIYIFDRKKNAWFQSVDDQVFPDAESKLRSVYFDQSIIKNYGAFQAIDSLVQKLNKQKNGFLYVLISNKSDYLPFGEKEGFLQGENVHVIIGEILE